MQPFEAKFKIVRPMFMFGTGNSKVELRAPSIKGALRFWWRALARGKFNELSEMKDEEARTFGSSNQAVGQSKVLVSIRDERLKYSQNQQLFRNPPLAYVGYGLSANKNVEYVETGTFTVSGLLRSDKNLDEKLLFDAFKVMGLIGGIGGRSRRGWGSLTLQSLDKGTGLWTAPKTIKEYKKEIDFLREYGKSFAYEPEYTSFSSKTRIEIGMECDSSEKAHSRLAKLYKDYMGQLRSDKKYFGLPRGKNSKRRASPVFFHVHELDMASFLPVISFFPAKFDIDKENTPGWDKNIIGFLDKVKSCDFK